MAKILIVDDSEDNRDLLAYLLGRRGHTTILATSGEEAVATATSEQPDLIVMDIAMPGMGGQAAARAIRGQPALAATPIVGYTATFGTPLSFRGPEEGVFDGFIRLPIEPVTLVAEIEAHLPSPAPIAHTSR